MSKLYVLVEHACGYSLFNVKEMEEIGTSIPAVEESVNDVTKFKSAVGLIAFQPFSNASVSLNNISALSEGIISDELKSFLENHFPKKATLGVLDSKLAAAIGENMKIKVELGGVVPEILRGIRFHYSSLIKDTSIENIDQAQLGLAHAASRMEVKYNINKVDTMITHSISLLDQMEKNINLFAMRIREWYSYHFPELAQIVTDNKMYALCTGIIGDRNNLPEDVLDKLEAATKDSAQAESILEACKMSMGMDISSSDLTNIKNFARRVASLSDYKLRLSNYMKSKMNTVAPNLSAIIGEVVGARLIAHAGSLQNLAKVPASTVQILGAEKALFRAIKTRSNTPKYGLIYHSPFISKAGTQNKGRISRFLANKCSLGTRIDCYGENDSNVFGLKLREQIEERLHFFESGDVPRKNTEVMEEALEELTKSSKKRKYAAEDGDVDVDEPPRKKKKKKKSIAVEEEE